jgi:hypothetical protein
MVETTTTLTDWTVHTHVPDGSGEITIPPPDPPGAVRFYRVRINFSD